MFFRTAFLLCAFGLIAANASFWSSNVQGWIYPGAPACNTKVELQDGRKVHVLKPQYFTVDSTGVPALIDEWDVSNSCNGYSQDNVNLLKKVSLEQFATVSGGGDHYHTLLATAAKRTQAVNTLVNFVVSADITGIEIDFEGFNGWDTTIYANYKAFITQLGNGLHAAGKKLMIDGPPIYSVASQTWYLFKWEDFNALPVDYFVVMAYDYMYDQGCGYPVAPLSWVNTIITWTKAKITDTSKIVIGIPSYGYSGTRDTYNPAIKTKDQLKTTTGFSGAVRDTDSQELSWSSGTTVRYYIDSVGLDNKRAFIESKGIQHISVWHLGGNDWFTSAKQEIWPQTSTTAQQQPVVTSQNPVVQTSAVNTPTIQVAPTTQAQQFPTTQQLPTQAEQPTTQQQQPENPTSESPLPSSQNGASSAAIGHQSTDQPPVTQGTASSPATSEAMSTSNPVVENNLEGEGEVSSPSSNSHVITGVAVGVPIGVVALAATGVAVFFKRRLATIRRQDTDLREPEDYDSDSPPTPPEV